MLTPRPYQIDVVERARDAYRRRHQSVLLVLPTGSGKTQIGGMIADGAIRRGKRVLWLACRRELVDQAAGRMPVPTGILMAGRKPEVSRPIQVGSIDTIQARGERPPADLVVYDEAHHATAATSRSLLAAYPRAHCLGLTATPSRADGTALGDVFDCLVEGPSIQTLIAWGFLVPVDVLAPDAKTTSLAKSPVEAWKAYADGRPGFVFCKTIAQSKELVADFKAAGFLAAHVDAHTARRARDAAVEGFRAGRIDILSSVQVFTEGVDVPRAQVCMLAKSTAHAGSYLQMVGRVLRPHPGKTRALIIDLVGNVHHHGFPDDVRLWSLDGVPIRQRDGDDREASVTQCPVCGVAWRTGSRSECARCGWEPEGLPGPNIVERPLYDARDIFGERAPRGPLRPNATKDEKTRKLRELRAVAAARQYKPNWVRMRFLAIYGHYPEVAL